MIENNEQKIVSLAAELLKNNNYKRQAEFPKRSFDNLSLNLITILMAAFAATTAGYYAGSYGNYVSRPLNRYERIEIHALVFYASRVRGLKEAVIQHEVELFIGSPLSEMSVKDFPAARSFLQDIIKPN